MRILAVDYGTRRTGLAWTDPLGLFATRLPGCTTTELQPTLSRLVAEGPVGRIVVGMPTQPDGSDTDATPHVRAFLGQLALWFPGLPVETEDERMTSRLAVQSLVDAGARKKQRQDKLLVDSQAATLLLQHYLDRHAHSSPI